MLFLWLYDIIKKEKGGSLKRKKILFVISLLLLIPSIVFAAGENVYVDCGGTSIPGPIATIVRAIFLLLQILVPVGIIVMGSLDFVKAVIAGDADKIRKNQKKFISRLITGALVFFVFSVIKLVINIVDSSTSNYANCLNCLINSNSGCNTTSSSPFPEEPDYTRPSSGGSSGDSSSGGSGDSSSGDSSKNTYEKTMYVGDSRTVGMCDISSVDCGESVAKESQGYSWFANTAVPQIDAKLKNAKGKNYNIVILMGVNGVGKTGNEASKYFTKYKELATGKWKDHNLVIVSVNPVVDGKSYAYTSGVNQFNSTMKQKINSSGVKNISYCDTLNGIGSNKFVTTDGLHYTADTYKKIYNYIESNCLK